MFKDRLYFLLGCIYKNIDGANNVPRNDAVALGYFKRAAELRHRDSQRIYGQMLRERGRHADSVAWLREAATRGDRVAQNDLGVMYIKGWGVAKNRQQGIEWLLRAYRQESTSAKNSLRLLGVNAR